MAHQRQQGKPPSCDVEHQPPGTLRRRCHNQRLCGAARLGHPPPLHPPSTHTTGHLADLKKCHESWWQVQGGTTIPTWGSVGLTSFFQVIEQSPAPLGLVRSTLQSAPPVEAGLEIVFQKALSKFISVSSCRLFLKQKKHCSFCCWR